MKHEAPKKSKKYDYMAFEPDVLPTVRQSAIESA